MGRSNVAWVMLAMMASAIGCSTGDTQSYTNDSTTDTSQRAGAPSGDPVGQLECNVVLEEVGDNKDDVISAIQTHAGVDLDQATELVAAVPTTVVESVSKQAADKLKADLDATGAKSSIEIFMPVQQP